MRNANGLFKLSLEGGDIQRIRHVAREMDFTAADLAIPDTDKEFPEKVKAAVQLNLSNSEFTTEMLAEEVGMSRTLLFKKLKGLLDETGWSFILSMRMKAAVEYLRKSDYNISEICYMVGFSDPKYFTRVFKNTIISHPLIIATRMMM